MPEQAIKDKRAQTDEAIRPTIGSEKLQVGLRPVEDYSANFQQDPSLMSAVFNPDIFNALGKISKDVHETRRNSRYYDSLLSGQQSREELADLQEVALEHKKLAADNALADTQIKSLHQLSIMLNEADRSATGSKAEVYRQFSDENHNLEERNYAAGNIYLAEKIAEWNDSLIQANYSAAVAADKKKEEDKRVYNLGQLNKASALAVLRSEPGYEDVKTVVESDTRRAIKSSNVIADPDDRKTNNLNNQVLYKAKADQIFNDLSTSASAKLGALQVVIAEGRAMKEAVLDENGKEVKDEKGNTKYRMVAPYVVERRQASETEQIMIQNRIKNRFQEKGVDIESANAEEMAIATRAVNRQIFADTDGNAYLNLDKNGKWDGTITEKWDTGADPTTIAYIQDLIGRLDWGKEAAENLHAADSYRKATKMDELIKGNYLDNPYLYRGGNNAIADYNDLQKHAILVYAHGTTDQQNKMRNYTEQARKYVVAPTLMLDQMRVMVNNGWTVAQIIQYFKEKQARLGEELNKNQAMHSLSEGAFDFLILSDETTGINYSLGPTAALMAPGDEPGFFNYAWGQNMYDVMGSLIGELEKTNGENIVQFFPYMNNAFQLVANASDASNLQSRNEDGTYSNSQKGIKSLSEKIQTTIDLGGGLSSEHAALDKIVDINYNSYQATTTVQTRENQARAFAQAAPGAYMSYIGSNTVTDKNKKAFLNSVGSYALFHPNGGNIPQHSEWERIVATSKESGGVFANPDTNIITTLQKEGFTATKSLSYFLQKVDPQYHGAVTKLYCDMYAGSYTHRNDLKVKKFNTKPLEDIISYNFRSDGSYKFPLVVKARTHGSGKSVPISEESYEKVKKQSEKQIKKYGMIKSGELAMPDPIDGTRAVRIAGVNAQVYNGDKYTDLKINTQVPPGMKASNARVYENEMGSTMLNLYAFTHTETYKDIANAWKDQIGNGRDMQSDQQEAMRILSAMNNPDNQQVIKMIADGQINPPLTTEKGDESFYKWIATGNLAAFAQGPSGLTPRAFALSPQEQRMVKMLKAAHQLSANKIQAQTYLYNTDIKVDPSKQGWTRGMIIPAVGGTKMTITSPFGYRPDPLGRSKSPEFHFGVDVHFADGIVHNQYSGTVVYSGEMGGYGKAVIIKRGNLYFLYGHMASTNVQKGDKVQAGQSLGIEGSTGSSTGKHCHFGVSRSMYFNTAHKADAVNPASVYSPSMVPPQAGNAGAGTLKSITKHSLKQSGYTYTDQDDNYMNTWVMKGKTFDATDAALCGRSFGPTSKSSNNLDPKNEQHRQRVYGMLFCMLDYKVFKGDKEKAAAAMYPGMKFQYKLSNGTLMKPQFGYQDILKNYKNGNLRRWGAGEWVPVNHQLYNTAVGRYKKSGGR